MEMENNGGTMEQSHQGQPQLCTKGCSFFANVGCGGMCSKCHRETLSEQERNKKAAESMLAGAAASASGPATTSALQQATPAPPVVQQEPQPAASPSPAPAPSTSSPAEAPAEASGSAAGEGCKGPSRCFECRRKVGLTGFKCKCGNLYCGQHRYAESHACPFDYKNTQRAKLAESNPVVQASKVQKI